MDFFINLKSSVKAFIGLTLLFALMLVITIFSIRANNTLNGNVKQTVENILPSVHLLSEIDRDLQQVLVAERSILQEEPGTEAFNNFVADMEENIQQTDERWQEFKKVFDLTTENELIREYESNREKWLPLTRSIPNVLMKRTETSYQEALALSRGQAAVEFEAMRDVIDVLGQKEWDHAQAVKVESQAIYTSNQSLFMVLLVIGILAWIGLSFFIHFTVTKAIKGVIDGIANISDNVVNGRLKERVDTSMIAPEFRPISIGVNEIIVAFHEPIKIILEYLDKIAKGDIPPEITAEVRGDFDTLKNSVNNLIRIINGLLKETDSLINAATNGNLAVRGNEEKFENSWKEMISGINHIVDAFVKPINTTTNLIQRISVGDMPPLITEEYKGDFNKIKTSVNLCISNINGLLAETNVLIAAIKAGKLDVRGKANQFQNSWKELIVGINDLVVAFVTPINLTSDYLQRISEGNLPPLIKDKYQGDFNIIISNLNQMINIMDSLLKETGTLIRAATDGQLKARGEEKKFKNSWREMVGGINKLMDAIINPINEAMTVMHELANKNMTARVRGTYRGDLNTFTQNINNAGNNLEDALSQVDRAVQQISSASGEIANGSQSLASGSSEQASSLEEIASSLEQMNSLTLNNAENSRQGMTLSEESLKHVESGNTAMTRMTSAMAAITQSAHETSNIIKTINDIAFQTNLLALNAAVEAAHAGEAGKGFAVVAEEVKNLALRSAEAAKNTDELIETSLKNSQDGSKIVDEVTQSFGNIQTSFSKVNNIVKEISVSSDEQAKGIRQVSLAVGELNKVTQGNAANAEESASAAEELNSQASELRSMVNEFKLTNSSNTAMSRRFEEGQPELAAPGRQKALPGPSNKYAADDIEIVLPLDDGYDDDGKDF